MLPNVSETLKRSFKISTTVSSCVLWVCFMWCDSFSSQVVIAVAFGTVCFFFFLHILTQYTHMLTKIYIYICAYAQAETNTEWLSSVFYLLNQFSKLQYCSLFLFKMPKAIFPTFLFLLQGCQAFDKARQAKLPGMGSSSLDHALLNVFLKVRRSAHPLITGQLGLQRWPCTQVLGNPRRPSWWSHRAKEGNWAREAEVLEAQTTIPPSGGVRNAVGWQPSPMSSTQHSLAAFTLVSPGLQTDTTCCSCGGRFELGTYADNA